MPHKPPSILIINRTTKLLFFAFIIAFSFCKVPLFAQSFQPNKQGYVADPKFKELIRSNGYQLVGAFMTLTDISPKPKLPPVIYAQAIKGGHEVYITPNGKEVDLNKLGKTYDPRVNTSFGGSNGIAIDVPAEDKGEKFEQVVENGKYGTRNIITKKPGLPAIYDGLSWFGHGLVSFKANGKEGLATTEGKILLEPKYESIGTYGMPDKKGKQRYYHTYLNKKRGMLNGDFKEIIPPVYDMVSSVISYPDIFIVQNNKLQGLVDQHGKTLTSIIYSRLVPSRKGLPLIVTANNKKGLIDSTGKVLIDPVYDEISYNWEEKSFKLEKDRKYGVASEAGKIVVQPDFDYIYDLKDNIAIVKKGTKFGALTEKWDFVMPLDYDRLFVKGSYLYAQKGQEASLFDLKGKKVVQGNFEEIYPVGNVLLYKAGGNYGTMMPSGKKLKKLDYDSVLVDNGFLIVSQNGKYGVFDVEGHELIPTKYDLFLGSEGAIVKHNILEARLGNQRLFVDFYGNEYAR